jgi:hypothetical protein
LCCLILPLLRLRIVDDATIAMQLHVRLKFCREVQIRKSTSFEVLCASLRNVCAISMLQIRSSGLLSCWRTGVRGNALSMLQISSSMLAVVPSQCCSILVEYKRDRDERYGEECQRAARPVDAEILIHCAVTTLVFAKSRRWMNIYFAKSGNPAPKPLRNRSLPARTLAAYSGYASGK